uniref:Uncharacterized protein n=1 Tax=Megaselia scalaris TaxID=36166 RepID=T1GWL5_MEGSC
MEFVFRIERPSTSLAGEESASRGENNWIPTIGISTHIKRRESKTRGSTLITYILPNILLSELPLNLFP